MQGLPVISASHHKSVAQQDLFAQPWFDSYSLLVNRLKRIISLIVLALWASCAIRCEAASLMDATAHACCGDATDDGGGKPTAPGHCVCSWVQSGGYISESTGVPLPQPVPVEVFTQPMDVPVALPANLVTELIFSPPELLTSWQFFQRAALSPRDPSFVS